MPMPAVPIVMMRVHVAGVSVVIPLPGSHRISAIAMTATGGTAMTDIMAALLGSRRFGWMLAVFVLHNRADGATTQILQLFSPGLGGSTDSQMPVNVHGSNAP
jgi:hypothetical protein